MTHPSKWGMGSGLAPSVVILAPWLDNLLCLLPQYVTHPAEQSVLIHVLRANVNFNSSGESRCALVLCAPVPAQRGELCWGARPWCVAGRVCSCDNQQPGSSCPAGVWISCGEGMEGYVRTLCTSGSRLLTPCLFQT